MKSVTKITLAMLAEIDGGVPPPTSEQSAIFRCIRCRDGEKPCVRGNPNQCEWSVNAVLYEALENQMKVSVQMMRHAKFGDQAISDCIAQARRALAIARGETP